MPKEVYIWSLPSTTAFKFEGKHCTKVKIQVSILGSKWIVPSSSICPSEVLNALKRWNMVTKVEVENRIISLPYTVEMYIVLE